MELTESTAKQELPACPVETTLTLISDKWKVLILRDLMDGTKRFGELKKSIGHVTQKVLTAQLRQMEESGLLTGHFRAAAQLLPERCSLAGKWGVRAEQGRLRFTCLSAQLNDADLPQTAAKLVTDAMANALNRKLEELNVAPQRLAWSDGEIEIYA